uniref:Hermansky-Pudlak syndrome 1 protein homolog n=1 Tax=Glossina palpalis gambiensis TaxID=67801 RepID=A0A1B0BJL8_9MUSC
MDIIKRTMSSPLGHQNEDRAKKIKLQESPESKQEGEMKTYSDNYDFLFDDENDFDFVGLDTSREQINFTKLDLTKWQRCVVEEIQRDRKTCALIVRVKSTQSSYVCSENKDNINLMEDLQATCYLRGPWSTAEIDEGDILSLKAKWDNQLNSFYVDKDEGICVVNPDVLIPATTVVGSLFCRRKAVLQDRFRGIDANSKIAIASSMYDTFFVLQKIISVQMQGDSEALKPTYENLETFVRQTLDALKKSKLKGDDLEACLKKFSAKWENLRKMYGEFLKTYEREIVVRIESNIPSFMEDLKQLFTLSCCDSSAMNFQQLPEVAAVAEGKLLEFSEFLAVKAERNISIEAYLEDFPGLIHFIYINRSSGLMIAPDLKYTNQLIPSEKLWSMIEYTRKYLKKGQTTLMWKDKSFNYAYFLWFEDQTTGSIKAIDMQQHFMASSNSRAAFKCQFEPGLLAGDYYHLLTEVCFPKALPSKIKCYELFCIHLGLVTATCAVEHARRLVATIADVVGEDSF